MLKFLSTTFIILAGIGFGFGFVHGADKQAAYNQRQEVLRCEQGYTAACRNLAINTAKR